MFKKQSILLIYLLVGFSVSFIYAMINDDEIDRTLQPAIDKALTQGTTEDFKVAIDDYQKLKPFTEQDKSILYDCVKKYIAVKRFANIQFYLNNPSQQNYKHARKQFIKRVNDIYKIIS